MSQTTTCDLCHEQKDCVVVYIRYRHMQDGQRRDAGYGSLDICSECLRTVPRVRQMGRPRRLRVHDAA